MNWLRSILMPVQGSAYAREVDSLFFFVFWLSVFFFVLVAGLVSYFVVRYRRRRANEATPHITHNFKLELVWTVIPLVLLMVVFFRGFNGFINAAVAPADAMEIQVSAKKWIWQFEYPNGVRTLNELHVPVGKPVKLVMSSEDVIHSFFMPSFRIKNDVLPNRYTEIWFQPTEPGVHQLFCAEYCGKGHSDMLAKIYVDDEKKYQDWLETGGDAGKNMPLPEFGRMLFESRGCETCHSLDGTRKEGPTLKSLFGHPVKLANGSSVIADENYLRESILQPQAKIVSGFEPVMPTFQGLLRQRELNALVEFVKSQK